jgi:hypothetical protein
MCSRERGRSTSARAAELSGLCVLHLDRDYELIATITGQPIEALRSD